jgi:Arc/MetJ-type ribon-helix-helix transcriptional regulator
MCGEGEPDLSLLRNAERIADCYAEGMQLVVRVPDEVAMAVDRLVSNGVFDSRSDVVRAGVEVVLERERRAAVGRAIVAGYERVPQSGDDLECSDTATAAMIAEEPW